MTRIWADIGPALAACRLAGASLKSEDLAGGISLNWREFSKKGAEIIEVGL
jgi:hypothetical protein